MSKLYKVFKNGSVYRLRTYPTKNGFYTIVTLYGKKVLVYDDNYNKTTVKHYLDIYKTL